MWILDSVFSIALKVWFFKTFLDLMLWTLLVTIWRTLNSFLIFGSSFRSLSSRTAEASSDSSLIVGFLDSSSSELESSIIDLDFSFFFFSLASRSASRFALSASFFSRLAFCTRLIYLKFLSNSRVFSRNKKKPGLFCFENRPGLIFFPIFFCLLSFEGLD